MKHNLEIPKAPEDTEQPTRRTAEPQNRTSKVFYALAGAAHKFGIESVIPVLKRSGYFRNESLQAKEFIGGSKKQRAFLQDHPDIDNWIHIPQLASPYVVGLSEELRERADAAKQSLVKFLSHNLNDEVVSQFLDQSMYQYNEVAEHGLKYVRDILFPKFKSEFSNRIIELCRTRMISLSPKEIERRLARVEAFAIENPQAAIPFTGNESGFAATSVSQIFLQCNSHILISLLSEEGSSAVETLRKTYFHEMAHAISGQTWQDDIIVGQVRTGFAFHLDEENTQEKNYDYPDQKNSRLMWLNEAVTEGVAQDMLQSLVDGDSFDLFKNMATSSYGDERMLLKKIVETFDLDQRVLLEAYFENYDHTAPLQSRLVGYKKFMRAIGKASEPGFLMKIEHFTKNNGVGGYDEISALFSMIDKARLLSAARLLKKKIERMDFSSVCANMYEVDFAQSNEKPHSCKEVFVEFSKERSSSDYNSGWNWLLDELKGAGVFRKDTMTIDDVLAYVEAHPDVGVQYPLFCLDLVFGKDRHKGGPQRAILIIKPDGAGGRMLELSHIHGSKDLFYTDKTMMHQAAHVLVRTHQST